MRTERFDLNSDGSARLMVDIYDETPATEKAPAFIYVPGGAFMMCVETDRGTSHPDLWSADSESHALMFIL